MASIRESDRRRKYRQENRDRIRVQKHESYERNKERIRVKHREYYLANKERINAQKKEYYSTHREQFNAWSRAWREANRGRRRAYVQKWSKERYHKTLEESRRKSREDRRRWKVNNPEAEKAIQQRRRARKRLAQGDATAEQIRARVEYWGYQCWICRGPYEVLDHVKPLALGGSNWPSNLRPICKACNASKRDRWYPGRRVA